MSSHFCSYNFECISLQWIWSCVQFGSYHVRLKRTLSTWGSKKRKCLENKKNDVTFCWLLILLALSKEVHPCDVKHGLLWLYGDNCMFNLITCAKCSLFLIVPLGFFLDMNTSFSQKWQFTMAPITHIHSFDNKIITLRPLCSHLTNIYKYRISSVSFNESVPSFSPCQHYYFMVL